MNPLEKAFVNNQWKFMNTKVTKVCTFGDNSKFYHAVT